VIPFIHFERLHLPFQLFGAFLVIAVWVGSALTHWRARELGLDKDKTSSMFLWSLLAGLVLAHAFDLVAYQWAEGRPSLWTILNPFAGLSSYGGFGGSLLGMFVWCKVRREPYLPYVDSCAVGLAVAWFFGRVGCFTAHDHPGRPSGFVLAVRYPGGARHDLGLYEALLALGVSLLFWWLARRKQPLGVYTILCCLLYGPARFLLDFLRATDVPGADPRYFGLTPGQYASLVITAVGLALIPRARREARLAAT